jgi:hypothetical protein
MADAKTFWKGGRNGSAGSNAEATRRLRERAEDEAEDDERHSFLPVRPSSQYEPIPPQHGSMSPFDPIVRMSDLRDQLRVHEESLEAQHNRMDDEQKDHREGRIRDIRREIDRAQALLPGAAPRQLPARPGQEGGTGPASLPDYQNTNVLHEL